MSGAKDISGLFVLVGRYWVASGQRQRNPVVTGVCNPGFAASASCRGRVRRRHAAAAGRQPVGRAARHVLLRLRRAEDLPRRQPERAHGRGGGRDARVQGLPDGRRRRDDPRARDREVRERGGSGRDQRERRLGDREQRGAAQPRDRDPGRCRDPQQQHPSQRRARAQPLRRRGRAGREATSSRSTTTPASAPPGRPAAASSCARPA